MKLNDLIKEDEIVSRDLNAEALEFDEITTDRDLYRDTSLLFVIDRVKENKDETITLNKQPRAVIISEGRNIEANCPVIKVRNSRRALAFAYSQMYGIDYSNLKVIGVTGTNGKTTTASMLYKILRQASYKAGLIGTGKIIINDMEYQGENYSMTTPDPEELYKVLALMAKEGCEYAVMEVSSHALALEKTAPIKFSLGIFTNLSKEHSDFHSSMEDYYGTKKRLFQNCASAVINLDDAYGRRLYKEVNCEAISVGALYPADVYATNLTFGRLSGSEFIYKSKGPMFKVRLKTIGAFNVYNAMLALCGAIKLGVRACVAKEAIERLEAVKGRMEKISEAPYVFIDYAHTPYAFENSLVTLKSALIQGQKLAVVFGCGGNRDKAKRKVMGNIAEKYADKIVVTEDNSRSEEFEKIAEEILSGIKLRKKLKIIKSRPNAIKEAITKAEDEDVILISGKGEERYIIDKSGTRPYSEYDSVRQALSEREEIRK